MQKRAFTLAEVLITLTIIGVIAAITIPNLLQKHMQKELEVAFNKSVALLNQGLSLMAYDEGAGLKAAYATWDGTSYSGDTAFPNFYNYLKIQKKTHSKDIYAKTGYYKNFNKTSDMSLDTPLAHPTQTNDVYVSPGGMLFHARISSSEINIIVDTNGVKGPNRAGYDYFRFAVSDKDRIMGTPLFTTCSLTSTTDTNGFGCSQYAIVNKCPWDNSKTYWECLK